MRTTIALIASSIMAATSAVTADDDYLDKDEALAVTKGMTWKLRIASNQTRSEYHAVDGTIYTGKTTNSYGVGEWGIDETGRYCINHPGWNHGWIRCQTIRIDRNEKIKLYLDNTPGQKERYARAEIAEGGKYDFLERYSTLSE